MNSIGTVWVFVLLVIINLDIGGRALFNHPVRGVPEIVALSIVACVFLQIAHTLKVGRLTRSDIVLNWLHTHHPNVKNFLEGLYLLIGAGLMAILLYSSIPLFTKAWRIDEYVGAQGDFMAPVWPVKLIILIGCTAGAIQFFLMAIGCFRKIGCCRRRKPVTDIQIGLLSIVGILFLIYAGMHVSIALMLLSFLGVGLIKGNWTIASKLLALAASDSISGYIFGVVPLFVLMGLLISISGIGKDTFDVANRLFRGVRGGLGISTVAANAIFAAVTGISIASAAVFTKVAVPEMIRLGHKPRFAVGVVTGSSVLGMLIPPSLLLILFGVLTETSIGDLFKAGILPGILLSAAYSGLILLMAWRFPDYVGRITDDSGRSSAIQMGLGQAIWKLTPIVLLVALVLGGIYAGWFTPTESGAVGALGALILALGKRQLSWVKLWQVLTETGHVTVAILFLLIAANIYGRMLALSGITGFIAIWISESGLGLHAILAIYLVIVLLMGTILDSTSIMMIIVPLMYPIMHDMGVNFVWFGLVTVIAIEVGLITPPLGIAAYVVKSTLDDQSITLNDVFAGAFPYVLIMIMVLVLVVIFPQISLVLVR